MRDGDDAKYWDTKNRLNFLKKKLKSLHVRVFILGIRSQLIKLNLLSHIRTKNMHPFGHSKNYMMPSGHAILRGVEHKIKKIMYIYKSYHFTLFFFYFFFYLLVSQHIEVKKKKAFIFFYATPK